MFLLTHSLASSRMHFLASELVDVPTWYAPSDQLFKNDASTNFQKFIA